MRYKLVNPVPNYRFRYKVYDGFQSWYSCYLVTYSNPANFSVDPISESEYWRSFLPVLPTRIAIFLFPDHQRLDPITPDMWQRWDRDKFPDLVTMQHGRPCWRDGTPVFLEDLD